MTTLPTSQSASAAPHSADLAPISPKTARRVFAGSLIAALAWSAAVVYHADSGFGLNVVDNPIPHGARTSATRLHDAFNDLGYNLSAVGSGAEVPRVFLASLPTDLPSLDSVDLRKRVFLRTMLPLILRANERVQADRARLIDLRGKMNKSAPLSGADRAWLDQIAGHYGVKSGNMAELLRRVDIVPASLALAQSAEESGWGTSRFAQQGNALFGHTTPAGTGMAPAGRRLYDIRAFDTLSGAVEAYLHNLNTHRAYASLRKMRAEMRARSKMLDSSALAGTLLAYSERGQDYVETLRVIMRVNELANFDTARLRDQRYRETKVASARL